MNRLCPLIILTYWIVNISLDVHLKDSETVQWNKEIFSSNTCKIKLRSNLLQKRLDLRSVFKLSHEEPLPENPFWKAKRSLSLWRRATAHALIYRREILLSFLPFIFPDPFIRLSSARSKLSSLIFHMRWRKRQRKEREWMILLGSITATNGNFSG